MTRNMNELRNKIVEKNQMLDTIKRNSQHDREKARLVKTELDSLLYQYFKMLRCC